MMMFSRLKRGRKIPATMVSQHPDHARAPYWQSDPFIGVSAETRECFLSFSELGVSEYKWDWEGKLVDESVIERLFSEYFEYFQKSRLGIDKFLTFRLPNPRIETEFRLGRAFMNMLTAAGLAQRAQLPMPPIFEAILPMTESADEMIALQEAFLEMASLKHPLYRMREDGLSYLSIIPLFEDVTTIADSAKILSKYVQLHKKAFGFTPEYLRPYIARSDPALNAGIIPTVLAIKIALSSYLDLEQKTGIALYPIIGSASLPFRGGLRPDKIDHFLKEYAGIRTALLQSAFRYDFEQQVVRDGVATLEARLQETKATHIPKEEERELRKLIARFSKLYQAIIPGIADDVNMVASQLPKRRERVQHVGLFGYSRGEGGVKLPRAIGFTAALYSLGVPPELLGTGRALADAKKHGTLALVEKYFLYLKHDLEEAAAYTDKAYISQRAASDATWRLILEDVEAIEAYIGHAVGPRSEAERAHFTLVQQIRAVLDGGARATELITKAAELRKSLG